MIDQLPSEALLHTAGFLHAKDVLSLLSTNVLVQSLGASAKFWNTLSEQHYDASTSTTNWQQAKHEYLLKAHCDSLESVRWHRIADNSGIGPREGHLGCRLGQDWIITGGFVQDRIVYIKRPGQQTWHRSFPPRPPRWAYGATLTALADGRRAVRFGGFEGGGYSNETSHVTVLHHDGNGVVRWEPIVCKRYDGVAISEDDRRWNALAARAYSSTILLFDRFLLVVGGMQATGSGLGPILLGAETWTWYHENITSSTGEIPSPRHGASIVDDIEKRGRLVMFGGGSGSDLLRSGFDKSEVWELRLNGCNCAEQVLQSLPWSWNCIHQDRDRSGASGAEVRNQEIETAENADVTLSPAEQVNLGRCHASFRVGCDSVILAFGGGRPSCNSILGYRLDTDTFTRPNVVGPLPKWRFTFAAINLADSGYLLFHGGFCSQDFGAVDDMCVLDLAAGMGRSFDLLPEQRGLTVQSYPMITDAEVARQGRRSMLEQVHIVDTIQMLLLRGDIMQMREDAEAFGNGESSGDDESFQDDEYLEVD